MSIMNSNREENDEIKYVYGIEFELENDSEVPKHLKYKISVLNNHINNDQLYRKLNYKYEKFNSWNDYLDIGFCQIQASIDLAHISIATNNTTQNKFEIWIKKMPIPARNQMNKLAALWSDDHVFIVVIIITFSLLVMLPVIVKRIVEEKATTIMDYLTLLGIAKTQVWFSIIIDSFVILGSQNLIIAFIMDITVVQYIHYESANTIHSHSLLYGMNFSLFLFFLFIFLIQSILFGCLISVFFKSPNIAVIATIITWILSLIIPIFYLFVFIGRSSPTLSLWGTESLSCLIPNCALFWFIWISYGLSENASSGATWSHISDAGYLTDEMSLGHILIVMLISYPLYGLFIWYLSSIIPFKNTIAQPFYFPLLSIYNKFFIKKKQQNSSQTLINGENYPIIIKNLSKKYKSMFGFKSEYVLKNIDLEIENKSISVILGPNGSGKTTLINIMTGLLESEGQVIISGHDMTKERQSVRNITGICPQDNAYYKFLTVGEHLQLFSDLKKALRQRNDGFSCQELIDLLDLKSDMNTEALKLSGGTMRRLVLGMALIGPNDVLLLDEPTAGLDPKVRRKVWDLIIDLRKSKSVLITSHDLEEANLLSDMIVIIANGNICFKGSTLQMKKKFHSGYQLKITKSFQMETEKQITKTISKYTKIKTFIKNQMRDNEELQYGLNFEDSQKFSSMFDELEVRANDLAINNISLEMTTLEDSYVKILHKNCETLDKRNDILMNDNNDCLIQESIRFEATEQKPLNLLIKQIIGILIKRLNYLSKHYILFVTLIIIPIFLISLLFVAIEVTKHSTINTKQLKNKLIYGNGKKAFIATNETTLENEFSNTYKSYLEETDLSQIIFDNKNIEDSLLLYSSESFLNYFHNLLYGVSTDMTNETLNLIVWYNYAAFHSLPISLNLMTTALLRHLTNDNSYDITISNSPLEVDWSGRDLTLYDNYLFASDFVKMYFILYMFGLTFTFASYVLLPINELRSKFKLLQLMSGLNPMVYWFANFIFDFTLHAICSLLYTSVYHVLDSYEFFSASKYSFISIYLMFTFYGFSFIPFAYLISLFSRKPSTGLRFISLYNIICGTIAIALIMFLFVGDDEDTLFDYVVAESLFIVFPIVLFSSSINALHIILGYNTFCYIMEKVDPEKSYCDLENLDRTRDKTYATICCEKYCKKYNYTDSSINKMPHYIFQTIPYNRDSYHFCYQWLNPITHLSTFYVRYIFYGFLYFIIIFIIEIKYFHKFFHLIKRKSNTNENFELQQNQSEEVSVSQLVRSGDFNREAFIVDEISKQFKKSLIIPNKLSFTVHKEECFGLLGINGSGKSTTFRLITGDLSISSGNAYFDSNVNLLSNNTEFYKRIGYCPQNDALLDRLTGMQTLKLFGRLRGLESNGFEKFITNIIEKFELKNIIHKRLSTYSGGNRRKISLSIALIGTPSLLLLDEPTTGVDPDSRLKIWQLLRDLLINYKTSILLTSHNMFECEALCSRLAVLSNGVLKTIGFISDLKKRYAKGFIIILKVNLSCSENSVEELKFKVNESFGDNCVLKYSNLGVFYYELIRENIKLSQIFSTLESIKSEYNLEDYYVSNASLEQAFISLVDQ